MLLTANHSDVRIRFNGDFITVEKGQILTSIRTLADKWRWSVDKVSRFLKLIESDGMIKKDSDNFRTLITIENYELYQDEPNANSTPIDTPTETKQNVSRNKQELRININNIYAQNSSCESEQEIGTAEDKKSQQEEISRNFQIIYDSYPKKVGKARGFDLYKGWLKGRDISGRKIKLTNKQMWLAIERYKHQLEHDGTDKQYIKQFDTFMCKAILDYVEEEE